MSPDRAGCPGGAAAWCSGASVALLLLGWRVGLLKGGWLLRRLEDYRAAAIGRVAAIETGSALLSLLLAGLALLPATLQPIG